MTKKKYTPPTWDEKGKRWRKVAYCNGMSKTFCSTKRGITSAEKEINTQISVWKDKVSGLGSMRGLSPMSRVDDIYKEYKLDIMARTSKGNWRPIVGRMEHWVLPTIGRIPVVDINSGILQRVINAAYRKGSLSKKTLENMRSDMIAFVKFCRKNQLTSFVPEGIEIPRSAKVREKSILQPSDLRVLFTIDTTTFQGKLAVEPYINAYRLQVLLCLRPGEVGGLRASDLHGNVVHLHRSLNVDREITTGKNENAVRALALSDLGMQIWQSQLSRLGENPDWLFPGWTEKKYYHHLQKYCEVNGITPVSPYELRHTSFSVAQVLPEGLVKQMGGHSKNMDTFGIYGHEVQGDKELTAELMQDRIRELIG